MLTYCELPQLSAIGFSGEDAQSFLHNQLTCDVAALGPGLSTYGSYCTPKGRILATFLLWYLGDRYFMQLPSSLREAIQKRLSMYVLRSKVKVEDAGAQWKAAGLSGRDAASHVERVLGAVPQRDHEVVSTPDSTVIRLPADRYEILIPHSSAPEILEKLKEGAQTLEPAHWDWLDIRAGVPTITKPTQEQFVPQMVNLDLIGGLTFTKGCYPGQEIVARMHFLGKLKQRMYLAHLSTHLPTHLPTHLSNEVAAAASPQPGDKLYSAALGTQSSGMVVNAARSPEGGHDLLAVIQMASAEGQAVHWKSPDGPALELLALPYEVTANP